MRRGRSGSQRGSSSGPNASGNRRDLASPTTRSSGVRVAFAEVAVRNRLKQSGGTWNPERSAWPLRHDRVVALSLKSHIVDEPASHRGCPGVERRESPCRCPGAIQGDARIHGWMRASRGRCRPCRPIVVRRLGVLVICNALGYTRRGDPRVQAQGAGQVLRDRLKSRGPSTTRRPAAPDLGPIERRHRPTRHGAPGAELSSAQRRPAGHVGRIGERQLAGNVQVRWQGC